MKQRQTHPVHEMMGGNVEATQRGVIAADMVPMLAEEAKKRQGKRTDLSEKMSGRSTSVPNGAEVQKGTAREVAAQAVGVGSTSVDRALRAKKKHEIRAPLTTTQKKYLLLLQRGYCLEIEKRSPGHVSKFFGAEIGGQEIKFDTAQRMIAQRLVEKIGEEDRTLKYEISPTAVQLLDSLREARG